VAVVQNGIIENFRSLREQLQAEGVVFRSDTDTEVIPHLLARQLASLQDQGRRASGSLLLEAVQLVLPQLQGAYALAVVWAAVPGALVVARRQAPLLIGLGEGEFLCASDTPALAGFTRTILPLEDGEVALLTPSGSSSTTALACASSATPPCSRAPSTWRISAASATSCTRRSTSSRKRRPCGWRGTCRSWAPSWDRAPGPSGRLLPGGPAPR
jgi:glucosamine--fructose-6-phosphate aminotransferase (isomerizing)